MSDTWTLRERDMLREKVSTLAAERNAAILEINRLRAALEQIARSYCVGPLDAMTLQSIARKALEPQP